MKRSGDGYQVTFHGEFRETHGKLLAGGARVAAVFGPDRPPDAESVEFMAFGHPIIEAIVARVIEEGFDGTTGTRRIRADKQLAPVSGWLFTYQFTVPGVRTTEHLVPVLVSDAGRVDVQAGRRIMERGASFDREEQEIDKSRIPANLDNAARLANDFANTKQQKLQRDAERQADDRVDQEVAGISARFDYRERVARHRVAATRATLHRLRTSDDDTTRRILPVWEANLQRDQELPAKLAAERHRRIAGVEKFRHPQVRVGLAVSRQNRGGAARIELARSTSSRVRSITVTRSACCEQHVPAEPSCAGVQDANRGTGRELEPCGTCWLIAGYLMFAYLARTRRPNLACAGTVRRTHRGRLACGFRSRLVSTSSRMIRVPA